MATPSQWLAGAPPRTLPAAIAPVLVGTGAAAALDGFRAVPALLALVVALALQVAVNYANDYSDGTRGTDADRVGPMRLVGSGAASPRAVLLAAVAAFGVAAVAGLALAALSSWWLVAVGAACIVAPRAYTRGPLPHRDPAPGAGGAVELVAGRRRRGLHRRRLDLHRRPDPLRVPGAGRGVRLHLLRAGRRRRDGVRADAVARRAGVRRRRADRAADRGRAGGQ